MKILVSACLLGEACRYDGQSKPHPLMKELAQRHIMIPVCPEVMGGLPTPRPPAERQGDRVLNRAGCDVTAEYCRGAQKAMELAREQGCVVALLKEKSPSCGSGRIYDGTFTATLTEGWGVTAQLLRQEGLTVLGESDIQTLLQED